MNLSGWPSCEPKIRPWTSKLQNRRVNYSVWFVTECVKRSKKKKEFYDSCKDCVVLNCINENRMKWV